jgi:hypothetical protein
MYSFDKHINCPRSTKSASVRLYYRFDGYTLWTLNICPTWLLSTV